MSHKPNTPFVFNLTAMQAQTIYGVCACLMEERKLFREIWPKQKERARVRNAVTRFERQLNAQYKKTGVEV